MTDIETQIRELNDRAELAELVARQGIWLDEGQDGAAGRFFTTDVVVTSSRGQAQGLEALEDQLRAAHSIFTATLHSLGNVVIDLDGDTATVQAHNLAVCLIGEKAASVAAAIHRYGARRTENGWLFDRVDVTPIALTAPLDRAR